MESVLGDVIPSFESSSKIQQNKSGTSNITNNTLNSGGITIQNMVVRNDQDIKLIAKELFYLQKQASRGMGVL